MAKGKKTAATAKRGSAVAQQGSAAAASRGVAMHSSSVDRSVVVTGDGAHVEVHGGTSVGTDPGALLQGYLRWLFERHQEVRLPIPEAGSSGSANEPAMPLAGIYTALRTTAIDRAEPDTEREARQRNRNRQRMTARGGLFEGPGSQTPALALLDRERKLVLLGEPGGGKSTLVAFLVLCLAGERLGEKGANLAALRSPLPTEQGHERGEKPKRQPWRHGSLLPVPVVLRDFAARGELGPGRASAQQVWDFLAGELASGGHAPCREVLERELREKGALVLLDGLDEVPQKEGLRRLVGQAVADCAAGLPRCRFLLTSRTYAWRNQGWDLPGFPVAELAPFDRVQIRAFLARWYGQLAQLGRLSLAEAEDQARELTEVIFGRDRLEELAERPLLLSLMASLHHGRGRLPEDRGQLYRETVDLLLEVWEQRRRTYDREGKPIVLQPSVTEWLKVDRARVRQALEKLAFEAHARQPELSGTADVPEGDLARELLQVSAARADGAGGANAAELLSYLSERAGILVRRGDEVYTFPHRTLQEYLAAKYLTDTEGSDGLADRARAEPDRWREVVLLAASVLGGVSQTVLWDLIEALCHREPPEGPASLADTWGAHLAGMAAAESLRLTNLPPRQQPKLERLRRWLVHLLGSPSLPAPERALAGRSLARLGDPREEVTTLDAMELCWVPAGPFWMGSPETAPLSLPEEHPLHEQAVPYGYWIGRYPITELQWQEYQRAIGTEVKERPRPGPFANAPAVAMTWHEARAFCTWLGERWRAAGLLPPGWTVCLPSEREWEKAARGGVERLDEPQPVARKARQGLVQPQALALAANPKPERRFPWGDEPDPERANYGDSGVGARSAAGVFVSGASPCGCQDLSGNVWEWTRSLWGEDLMNPSFGYPYDPSDGRELVDASDEVRRVLRGCAFYFAPQFVRCAVRNRYHPWGRDSRVGFRVLASPFSSDL